MDANDAPDGYYAVPKALFSGGDNICLHCDWRPVCQLPETDTLAKGQNCRGYALTAFRDGLVYQRNDGVGVVFKKK